MMPDLGNYAATVLSAYAVSIGLIVILVGTSIMRARRIRHMLDDIEQRRV